MKKRLREFIHLAIIHHSVIWIRSDFISMMPGSTKNKQKSEE